MNRTSKPRCGWLTPVLVVALFGALAGQEIFDAAKTIDLARVRELVQKDASALRARDPEGRSALHLAASSGSLPLVRLLLSLGADIDPVDNRLATPLRTAIDNGRDEVAAFLIDQGADLGRKDVLGDSALHAAVEQDKAGLVKELIDRGAEVDSRNKDGWTPFLRAARNTGSVAVGNLLLDHGADINAKDTSAYLPLNWAAYFGNKEFVDLLLDKGAEFDRTEGKVTLILENAARYGFERLFKTVAGREKGIGTDGLAAEAIMSAAVLGGSVEIVKTLQAGGVPLRQAANVHGWRPIHQAARLGRLAMIEFLIGQGADIKARTAAGKSAYNIAEAAGKREAMSLILKLGGDPGPQRFPALKGPFIGQAIPGKEPAVFGPDIIHPAHSGVTSTPDGKEFYWQAADRTIWTTRRDKETWTKPEAAPFSRAIKGRYADDVPFVTPDGKRMFFTSTRPVEGAEPGKENIWTVERTPEGWADPRPLEAEVNSLLLHWQVSVSANGTLYFSGTGTGCYGAQDLYSSRLVGGRYTKPVNLGPAINGPENEAYPYVAPDESYIIFGKGQNWEFFISFKGPDGQWLAPVKISPDWRGYCPALSPDGRYLFYVGFFPGAAGPPAVYWVRAEFIERLRPGRASGE